MCLCIFVVCLCLSSTHGECILGRIEKVARFKLSVVCLLIVVLQVVLVGDWWVFFIVR